MTDAGLGRGEHLIHHLTREGRAFRCALHLHRTVCSEAKDLISQVTTNLIPVTEGGFIKSREYPKYYSGGKRCVWSLRAEPGQRIFLRFIDISLREKERRECRDFVVVYERGKRLLKMCGESETDIMLLSQSHTLDVSIYLVLYS